MRHGALVLAGGRSSRMGRPKALLDWHGLPAVAHAVEVVREGVAGGAVLVVRAPGQELPPIDAIVVDDAVAHGGPLAALLAGLEALEGRAEVAFACGVDTPLLVPAFVRVGVRGASQRRRCRRAGDRRPGTAAARRLPRGDRPAPPGVARRTVGRG